ncbi:GNAT family N-acetyltransferase [Cytophagaceae bacterium DM2B3-1]|uniref:GNAT family N-acetyltransferase n=1 Tax=Xanthocytophaga flava TaxID=3048013 RepID=A0ABT7CKB4_9BACT|nr:GNAT family N-acetyltransferase [Xanthocytophaga flavus]MDJ1468535.1 GNAT family N-acetyltransferase [Xanthocytophaga flavus]MDJ1493430.1 GNAT family N-acetyltransferase [Xanthocytophaga flavus]
MIIIETPRLILRQLELEDDSFVLELVNTPSWLKFIGDRGVHTLEDARNYIRTGPMDSYSRFGFGLLLISLKGENVPIGMCGLLNRDVLDDPDIGFALLPVYEGKGYAFEAASAVLQYTRNELEIKRIVAIVMRENQRSFSLLQRLGFSYEKDVILPYSNEELLLFGCQLLN